MHRLGLVAMPIYLALGLVQVLVPLQQLPVARQCGQLAPPLHFQMTRLLCMRR